MNDSEAPLPMEDKFVTNTIKTVADHVLATLRCLNNSSCHAPKIKDSRFDTVEAIDELPSYDSFELAPDDF